MDGGEGETAPEEPTEDHAASRARRVASGQVWIACALCGRPVELADSLETVEGHACPECAAAL